jgi:hypothetical protein
MGYFYFDESIHGKGGFILGAFVYSQNDVDEQVEDAIRSCGLVPGKDEYKSGLHVGIHPEQTILRDSLKSIIYRTKIGVIVNSYDKRNELGINALKGLKQILSFYKEPEELHTTFFDENIFKNVQEAETLSLQIGINEYSNCFFEQDSKIIKGLQLADLVAHTCSIMLLETMGLVSKTVKAGDNSGYDPDMDIEIGFELWAGLRYNFFSKPPPHPDEWRDQFDFKSLVKDVGLYISDNCSEQLRDSALDRFGEMYLGCIH